MNYICVNGVLHEESHPVFSASNRSYRYGDGVFETIKLVNGEIQLAHYHFQRLFESISLLKIDAPPFFTPEKLTEQIHKLCRKNNCSELARIRLSVSSGNGGLYDPGRKLIWLIECWPINNSFQSLNENGLVIGLYPHARKSMDIFSGLKSANFLPYSQAAIFAKENKWNDAIILNSDELIADTTIANIFMVKGESIFTPANGQGAVNGVMRKYIMEKLGSEGLIVQEAPISMEYLLTAEEIFLTNAIRGISWVKEIQGRRLTNSRTSKIYEQVFKTITQ